VRVGQPEGTRGSLKWIQRAVERAPVALTVPILGPVTWLSPLRDDGFAEYRDVSFLSRLGLDHLGPALEDFWPRRGPQWDALGRADTRVVLVEAKARLAEFATPATQASATSRVKIEAAFAQVKKALGVAAHNDWTKDYYQYANRIAHLWWLRGNGVDAHLLFVDFLNDADVGGPSKIEAWTEAYAVAEARLGIASHHPLTPYMHHVYPDTTLLR
jgi:hypothetical protein